MKKIIALLLAALTVFGLAACGGAEKEAPAPTKAAKKDPTGFVVPQPMTERPMYLVSENPTEEELRETAVRAMHDMLSIQWSVTDGFMYNKTGAVSHKDYIYNPDTIYCGLPYADGQTNIYVWWEYYNPETGRLDMQGDGQWLNDTLGNTCAGSLMWAWSTVCDSLTGKYVNTSMVPKYGCIPVGDYKIKNDMVLDEFREEAGAYSTAMVCAENGLAVMLESYAQIKMADAITNSKSEHTMMVIENATVVRDADGNIDPIQSYVILQDQAAGTSTTPSTFYEHTGEDGNLYHYTGRTGPIAVKMTFKELFDASYIPVTTAEFLGREAYVKPEIKFSKENCTGFEDIYTGVVTSNYPMSMFKIIATDKKGNETTLLSVYFDRYDVQGSAAGMMDGKARNYKISGDRMLIEEAVKGLAAGEYTITGEVTEPNGEVLSPFTFTYKK